MFCFCFCFFKPVNKSSSQMELKIKYSPISLGKLRIWASVHHSFASMRQLGKKWFVTGGSLLSSLRASSPFGMRSRERRRECEGLHRSLAGSLTACFARLLAGLSRTQHGRNIVGQQLPTLLDVACCVRLHTLLHVVAQSLKPVKLYSQQLPTFLLFHDRRSVAQQCWIRLHSSSNIVGAAHAHYAWFTKTYGLYPSHHALQVPTLLGVVASVYMQP